MDLSAHGLPSPRFGINSFDPLHHIIGHAYKPESPSSLVVSPSTSYIFIASYPFPPLSSTSPQRRSRTNTLQAPLPPLLDGNPSFAIHFTIPSPGVLRRSAPSRRSSSGSMPIARSRLRSFVFWCLRCCALGEGTAGI
jgi:hypothetical protein